MVELNNSIFLPLILLIAQKKNGTIPITVFAISLKNN